MPNVHIAAFASTKSIKRATFLFAETVQARIAKIALGHFFEGRSRNGQGLLKPRTIGHTVWRLEKCRKGGVRETGNVHIHARQIADDVLSKRD